MKILLTGASGYIGKRLVRRLLDLNYEVVCCVRDLERISLPESVVESKPRETVVIFVSPSEVMVQGEPVVRIEDILAMEGDRIEAISDRLAKLSENVIGFKTKVVAESQEITILADKSVPFIVIKRIMSTCTGEGYENVSLAVIKKNSQVAAL